MEVVPIPVVTTEQSINERLVPAAVLNPVFIVAVAPSITLMFLNVDNVVPLWQWKIPCVPPAVATHDRMVSYITLLVVEYKTKLDKLLEVLELTKLQYLVSEVVPVTVNIPLVTLLVFVLVYLILWKFMVFPLNVMITFAVEDVICA